jgi:hypothetical protein
MYKLCLSVLMIVLSVPGASAAPKTFFLVGTTLQTSSASGFNITSTQAIAQQFVLQDNAKFTSITFVVGGSYIFDTTGAGGFGSDVPFVAQLTNGLGQGSIVLAQQQFTFSALPASYYATTFSFDGPKKLPAGTYYFVLSTMNTPDIGVLAWGPQSEIISALGHLGSAYCANPTGYANPNEAAFSSCTTPQTMQFQFIGK